MGKPDAAVAALAARRHGVVARAECLRLGMTRRQIDWRLASGRWVAVHDGVYALGPAMLSDQGRCAAALLAAGACAVLSHATAAALWNLQRHHPGPVHVTTTVKRRDVRGIAIHWTRRPPRVVTRQGLRVTSLDRTLTDMAETGSPAQVEQLIRSAERLHGFDRTRLQPIPGRHGMPVLRSQRQMVRGQLTKRFLRAVAEAGLEAPETEARLLGFEVDALWRAQRIVVEVDDYETHNNRMAMDRDRARDRALAIAGFRPVRVTHADIGDGRARMIGDLLALGAPLA